jgi:hypothetical protein
LSRESFNSNWIVPSIVFSHDAKRVAYAASTVYSTATSKKVGEKFIVIDGEPDGGKYDGVAGLSFSPDGKRFGFAAKRGYDILSVVDGKEFPTNIRGRFPLNPATVGAPVFSPDSRHFAYVRSRTKAGKQFWKGKAGGDLEIVVNGATSGPFDRVADLVWVSPDGLRVVACRNEQCFRIELELIGPGES